MEADNKTQEQQHKKVVQIIVSDLFEKINTKPSRYILSVAGESGSGKSETAKVIAIELRKCGIKTVILGQDEYCNLTPQYNDIKRKEDPDWLGPHVEIKMEVLQKNITDAVKDEDAINIPVINPLENTITNINLSLSGVKVIIAEGTYVSLLRNIDSRIFINRNRLETLRDRKKRNRRNEVNDSFTEQILVTEHKIIAGHWFLADYIITNDYKVLMPE